jgi:hypothetical protein
VVLLQIQLYCSKDNHSDMKIRDFSYWRRVLW